MKRSDWHIWVGAGLILLGALMLLERFGLLRGATNFFWGAVFLAGGGFFLYRFITNLKSEWWAAIPGFMLLGLSADNLLSGIVGKWSGVFFLGLLGAGFFVVYFSGRERWWALIPGGVLITLAFTSVLTSRETGGIFFLGLGLTFLLVAVLASLQWAYIPGVILLLFGALLGTSFASAASYIWPAVLILAGLVLIWQFVRPKQN